MVPNLGINGLYEASSLALQLLPSNRILNGREAAEAVGVGLRNLMTGVDHPPQYFTEQVLLNLQKMKRLFGGQSGATSITVWMNGQQTTSIERDISQRVSRILNAGYHNFGSLEGNIGSH